MNDDRLRDQTGRSEEELSVAAVSYIPPLFVLFFFWKRWRSNYFTRYHMVHAFLLNVTNIGVLLIGIFIAISITNWFDYHFLIILGSGIMICLTLFITAILSFYSAFQAYQGHFVILPGLTQVYYALFEQHAKKEN